MKTHTTNYFDTFIEVAEDSKADHGTRPPSKEKKTIAERQYQMIAENPYQFTSDDVLFQVYADRNDLAESEYKQAREQFFSKGQACLRTSPLAKSYGYGIHFDSKGKTAVYGIETPEYESYLLNDNIKKVKAMRSTR
ncbi:DUF6157 family protein [Albibacterium profundi]|uniref:DUF6157 family protein n=1 Tax=Albibacterium profundi TaxID=3134906 RepID=A0ABV5C9Y0_9SPHI